MNQLVTEARALSRAALNGPWVALCGKSAAAGEMMIRCTSLLPEMADEIERLADENERLAAALKLAQTLNADREIEQDHIDSFLAEALAELEGEHNG